MEKVEHARWCRVMGVRGVEWLQGCGGMRLRKGMELGTVGVRR